MMADLKTAGLESHMQGVNVKSEIKPLKKVLLHRPGRELLNLTPNTLEELLFDDIPFLKVAQEEHDAFAQILRDNGVEVVNLEKLMATIRSREISACLVLQAQSQLKALYKDNADTIIGNCDSRLFLGGSEPSTLKELSQSLGKETIDTVRPDRALSKVV